VAHGYGWGVPVLALNHGSEIDMEEIITAQEHYDRLADQDHGRNDPPALQSYMARWDGPQFYEMLGRLPGRDVLEIGIGVGRVARKVLKAGCHCLTGLDISPKTLAIAQTDLAEFANLELLQADICDFRRDEGFDVAYSVLTFMHVENKEKALRNIVASLRPGGAVVLSIDRESDLLNFQEWAVRLYPWPPEQYAAALEQIGCDVSEPVPLIDSLIRPDGKASDTYGERVATLIRGTKR
jgi:SAM-dependent methyltransferase